MSGKIVGDIHNQACNMPLDRHVHLLVLLVLFVASSIQGVTGNYYCCGYQSINQGKYIGAMATIDVYDFPNLEKGKETDTNMLVGDNNHLTYLQTGWEVNPKKYGDSKTHFYVYWTTDGKDGCQNLDCDGFVPVNLATITPRDILEPPNGKMNITVKIFKSEEDGDWWLYFGHDINNLSPVGYWPKTLVPNMQDHVSFAIWSGCVVFNSGQISPPMGNGQWPRSDSAASFSNVQLVDTSGRGYDPPSDTLHAYEGGKCYHIGVFRLHEHGNMFYYGGPGGCTS